MPVVSLVRKLAGGAKRRLKALKRPRHKSGRDSCHDSGGPSQVIDSAVDPRICGISRPSLRESATQRVQCAACGSVPARLPLPDRANPGPSGAANTTPSEADYSPRSLERDRPAERNNTMNEPNDLPSFMHDPARPSSPSHISIIVCPTEFGQILPPSPPALLNQVRQGISINPTVPPNESNKILDRDAFMKNMKPRLDPTRRRSNVPQAMHSNNDQRRSADLTPTGRASTRFDDPDADDPIITNTNRNPDMLPVGSRSSRVPNPSTERSNPVGSLWTPTNMTEFARQKRLVEDTTPQQHLEDFLLVHRLAADMYNLGKYVARAKLRTHDDLPARLTIESPKLASKVVYESVGCGAFGRVFRCQFPYPCRGGPLVVKVRIRPTDPSQNISGWDLEWRTERHILNRLAANQPHPNLVDGYQFDFWVQGVGLTIFDHHPANLSQMKSVQSQDNKLKTRLYAAVTGEIAAGLNHLHSLDIIHKDIKTDNILISWNGHCLITDYGACEMKDPSNGAYDRLRKCIMQLPGGSVFTPGFTAPETLFAGMGGYATYTEASDFWSLGVTMYSLVTNHECWGGATKAQPDVPDLALSRHENAPHMPEHTGKTFTHAELNLDGGCRMAEVMKQHGCPDVVAGLVLRLCQLDPQNRIPGAQVEPLTKQLIERVLPCDTPGRDVPLAIWQPTPGRMEWNKYY
ncbi:Protein kinase domain-containing protein [Mycena sanguinolenta]|uniref:Protein kinase domain-containing protein n=1 Tax=Mycena sanguinolenta TaxID=230812 RepID=A0A8H6U175_9AGAR|nr:Protein kinase domain-containing protein [Mycena sanguinolenta]